jgi:hypothetical protein
MYKLSESWPVHKNQHEAFAITKTMYYEGNIMTTILNIAKANSDCKIFEA